MQYLLYFWYHELCFWYYFYISWKISYYYSHAIYIVYDLNRLVFYFLISWNISCKHFPPSKISEAQFQNISKKNVYVNEDYSTSIEICNQSITLCDPYPYTRIRYKEPDSFKYSLTSVFQIKIFEKCVKIWKYQIICGIKRNLIHCLDCDRHKICWS